MSYIKTITVGGVSYELQPKIGPSSTITCVDASVYPYVGSINSDGALAVYLAAPTSDIFGLQHFATGSVAGVRGIGVDSGGALGLYVIGSELFNYVSSAYLGYLRFDPKGRMGVSFDRYSMECNPIDFGLRPKVNGGKILPSSSSDFYLYLYIDEAEGLSIGRASII